MNQSSWDTAAIAGSIDLIGVAKESEEVVSDIVGQGEVRRLGFE